MYRVSDCNGFEFPADDDTQMSQKQKVQSLLSFFVSNWCCNINCIQRAFDNSPDVIVFSKLHGKKTT